MMKRHAMLAAMALVAASNSAMASVGTEEKSPTPSEPRRRKHSAIKANLSRNHPDYGMSPAEHAAAKARRAAQ